MHFPSWKLYQPLAKNIHSFYSHSLFCILITFLNFYVLSFHAAFTDAPLFSLCARLSERAALGSADRSALANAARSGSIGIVKMGIGKNGSRWSSENLTLVGFEPTTTLNLTVKQSSYELGYWESDEMLLMLHCVLWKNVSAQIILYYNEIFEISKVDKNVNPAFGRSIIWCCPQKPYRIIAMTFRSINVAMHRYK